MFGRLDFDDGETYHIGRLGVRDGSGAAADRLAGARRRAVLPGHLRASRWAWCAAGSSSAGARRSSTSTTTCCPRTTPATCACSARGRCWPRCGGPAARTCATSSPPSSGSRTRPSGRRPGASPLITGGPGTGKTQVALHRAAYLLYTDRGRFTDGRILVVGPSTVFTNYISRVLPVARRGQRAPARARRARRGGDRHPPRPRGGRPDQGQRAHAGRADRADVADAADGARTGCGSCTRDRCSRSARTTWSAARRRVRARCEATGTEPNAARRPPPRSCSDALWAKVDGAHLDRELFAEEVGDRGEFRRFLQRVVARADADEGAVVARRRRSGGRPGRRGRRDAGRVVPAPARLVRRRRAAARRADRTARRAARRHRRRPSPSGGCAS